MRNAILMLLFAGAAFGASAGGSWYLKTRNHSSPGEEHAAAAEHGQDAHSGGDQGASGHAADSHATKDPAAGAHTPAGHGAATPAAPVVLTPKRDDLPVAARPRPMSVEEVLRFGMGLRKREEQLNDRENALQQEHARLQLAMADIRGEQQQIEGLHAKLQGQVEACQTLINEVQQARQQFSAEKSNAQDTLTQFNLAKVQMDDQEVQNIKKMSEWFQGMEPEKAAGAIKELANNGKTDLAVKLLSNFEERDAAKILSALDDYALMVELAERFKSYKQPAKTETRKR